MSYQFHDIDKWRLYHTLYFQQTGDSSVYNHTSINVKNNGGHRAFEGNIFVIQ